MPRHSRPCLLHASLRLRKLLDDDLMPDHRPSTMNRLSNSTIAIALAGLVAGCGPDAATTAAAAAQQQAIQAQQAKAQEERLKGKLGEALRATDAAASAAADQ